MEQSSSTPKALAYRVKNVQPEGDSHILNPWPGILVDSRLLESGSSVHTVQHDNGLISKFSLHGRVEAEPGGQLLAGQKLAEVASGRDYYWQIDASQVQ